MCDLLDITTFYTSMILLYLFVAVAKGFKFEHFQSRHCIVGVPLPSSKSWHCHEKVEYHFASTNTAHQETRLVIYQAHKRIFFGFCMRVKTYLEKLVKIFEGGFTVHS